MALWCAFTSSCYSLIIFLYYNLANVHTFLILYCRPTSLAWRDQKLKMGFLLQVSKKKRWSYIYCILADVCHIRTANDKRKLFYKLFLLQVISFIIKHKSLKGLIMLCIKREKQSTCVSKFFQLYTIIILNSNCKCILHTSQVFFAILFVLKV